MAIFLLHNKCLFRESISKTTHFTVILLSMLKRPTAVMFTLPSSCHWVTRRATGGQPPANQNEAVQVLPDKPCRSCYNLAAQRRWLITKRYRAGINKWNLTVAAFNSCSITAQRRSQVFILAVLFDRLVQTQTDGRWLVQCIHIAASGKGKKVSSSGCYNWRTEGRAYWYIELRWKNSLGPNSFREDGGSGKRVSLVLMF